jgi:carbon-monoxide dehydrogenase small subunit
MRARLITLSVDGREHDVAVRATTTLLEVLRERLSVSGVRAGCREGACGSCAVLLDGELVLACLVPAMRCDGAAVTSIAGLADGARLSAVQEAFIAEGASQCGYCTSGMVVAVTALLARDPKPTRAAVEAWLAGNICRCTGYEPIVRAALRAAATARAGAGE